MSKKDRRKLEKKRRKERQKRLTKSAPLAYRGDKYKTEKYVEFMLRTEVGVFEAFLIADRELTDHDVRRGLEDLIRRIRSHTLTLGEGKEHEAASDKPRELRVRANEDLVVQMICGNWKQLAEEQPLPGQDGMVGVLRTILGSIEVWSTPSPTSRGYLNYLEGFLEQAGVSVRVTQGPSEGSQHEEEDQGEEIEADEDVEEEEDELLEAGRAWARGTEPGARTYFVELAEDMIRSGEGRHVGEVCRRLLGEGGEGAFIMEISLLAHRADEPSLPPASPRPSPLGVEPAD